MLGLWEYFWSWGAAPAAVFQVGQQVMHSSTFRTGVVVLDNTASLPASHPGTIVLYADGTYRQELGANLVNVAGGWVPGTGPGA